jgi:hypothetical protein
VNDCPCGHSGRRVPRNRREALELVSVRDTVDLRVVTVDPARWLSVLQCPLCRRFWAEDSMSSGHAELYFTYPIDTDDPHTWLSTADPLDLPAA